MATIPSPIFYTNPNNAVSHGEGYYGPFERSGVIFDAAAYAPVPGDGNALRVWHKTLAAGSWTVDPEPPEPLNFAPSGGSVFFDGQKIWFAAENGAGHLQVIYFDCGLLAWTELGPALSDPWINQTWLVQPMPDGSVLVFYTRASDHTLGFNRLVAGVWQGFVAMRTETISLVPGGMATVVNDGVGNTAHVVYVDAVPFANIYYRKVFADNSMSAEEALPAAVQSQNVGFWLSSGETSGATARIFSGKLFVFRFVRTGGNEVFHAYVSSTLDNTLVNPTWQDTTIFAEPAPPAGGVNTGLGGQFIVRSGPALSAVMHGLQYDAANNIVTDNLWESVWNGATWNAATVLANLLVDFPNLPAGLPCGPGGQGWAGGNASIEPSITVLSNAAVGILIDFGISDPPGHCALNGFNIGYYLNLGAPAPPPPVGGPPRILVAIFGWLWPKGAPGASRPALWTPQPVTLQGISAGASGGLKMPTRRRRRRGRYQKIPENPSADTSRSVVGLGQVQTAPATFGGHDIPIGHWCPREPQRADIQLNSWNAALDCEADLWSQWASVHATPKNEFNPWIAIPEQGIRLNHIGTIPLPPRDGLDYLVLEFQVDQGIDGCITSIVQRYVGGTTGALVNGSGELTWRIQRNVVWVRDFGSMPTEIGDMQKGPWNDESGVIFIQSGDIIQYWVNRSATIPPTI